MKLGTNFKTLLTFTALAFAACTAKPTVNEEPPVEPPPEEKKEEVPGPARLEATAALSLKKVSVGQALSLQVTVKNTGASAATAVAPRTLEQLGTGHVRVLEGPTPAAVTLLPAESHTFVTKLEATDPGYAELRSGADGLDGVTSALVSAEVSPLELEVQSAPLLSIESIGTPSSVNVGQSFEVEVTVSNGGQAAAKLVALSLSSPTGGVTLDTVTPSAPVALLAAGETKTVRATVRATSVGALTLVALAQGADENSAAPVESESFSADPVTVENPAKLEALLNVPSPMTTGQSVQVTMVVKNTGDAVARNVAPSALTVSGTASASTTSTVTATDIPGGGFATFTWTWVASTTGTFALEGIASGVDANSNLAVSAAKVSSAMATVMAPSVLRVTEVTVPALLNPTQGFDVVVKVKNEGGTAANNVLPDPMPLGVLRGDLANANLLSSPTAASVAPGATATFTFSYKENGTGAGSLQFTAGARGVDAVSGAALVANPAQSSLVLVRAQPVLTIESVTLQPKLSRGQDFNVAVQVRNTGGTPATNVNVAATFTLAGGAAATVLTPATAVNLASGARSTLTIRVRENGTAVGSIRARATASGTNPAFNTALTSAAVLSLVTPVVRPAELSVTTLVIPATLNRGSSLALGMVVSNGGEADAKLVLPAPVTPAVVKTGGANITQTAAPTALTIPGQSSRTFTWRFTENGTSPGTLQFSTGVAGKDLNSDAALSGTALTSNEASVALLAGCNGAKLYQGVDGRVLDATRRDLVPGTDRLRIKPYSSLSGEFMRAFGSSPAALNGQASTFDAPGARWYDPQELSAITLYRAFVAAYQACNGLTGGAQYQTAPTAATAQTECAAWQRKFWSATPAAAETNACAAFATSASNDGATPRAKWNAVCASVGASMGFLAE